MLFHRRLALAFPKGAPGNETLMMFDVRSGHVLWRKPGCGAFQFLGETAVLHRERGKPIALLDARTGQPRATAPADHLPDDTKILAVLLLT
jgi:hypothetical protein